MIPVFADSAAAALRSLGANWHFLLEGNDGEIPQRISLNLQSDKCLKPATRKA